MPRSSMKYFVVAPPLRTHDCWDKIFTHETKFLLKSYFFKVETNRLWSDESNVFSMSIVTKKRSSFFILAVSVISDVNLLLSRICLFLAYAVCYEDIKSGRTFFSFSEGTFNIIFRFTFNKEIGLQFWMTLLSLSFFY